jgi:hypothetical protein
MLTVASWNINQNPDAWAHLGTLAGGGKSVDVALLQEAVPPVSGEVPTRYVACPTIGDPRGWRIRGTHRRPWCSAVVCMDAPINFEPRPAVPLWFGEEGDTLLASHPGAFNVGVVNCSDGKRVVLISLYAIWDRQGSLTFSEATLHRTLSDLAPVFYNEDYVLVAGDLNIWPYDAGYGWGDRSDAVFQRLRADGFEQVGPRPPAGRGPLTGCPCNAPSTCGHVRTMRHQRRADSVPYQLDYVFASKKLASLVRESSVRDNEVLWAVSDHCPIVTVLDV